MPRVGATAGQTAAVAGPVSHVPRLAVVRRGDERVSPLELFFDLVFVLAITQCTALMAADPTWRGLGRGLVVLGVLWWSWVGYSWLTSVMDPDEGGVRIVLFAAMAALLVASLCVPDAFGDLGTAFAVSYGCVRGAHIVLFVLASRDDPGLRHSVLGLAVSTAVGVAALIVGSLLASDAQTVVWALALAFDMVGPLFIDTSGWRLVAGHFAERHGLIVLVALGESIVAIGVGAGGGVDAGVVTAAILGIAVACALWWLYFDMTSLVAARRLAEVDLTRERNELARDAFSYLHLSLVAAIVLIALGLKTTLAHVTDPLDWELAAALVGGAALYLFGLVAVTARVGGLFSPARMVAGLVLVTAIPLAHEVDAVVTVGVTALILWAVAVVDRYRYSEAREAARHALR